MKGKIYWTVFNPAITKTLTRNKKVSWKSEKEGKILGRDSKGRFSSEKIFIAN